MAETKEITRLHVVIDSETPYDHIGDIDGGLFDEVWLESYVKSHGIEKLIIRLSRMQHQVLSMSDKIRSQQYERDTDILLASNI